VNARLAILLLALGLAAAPSSAQPKPDTVRVGSKNFTEQMILGELVAQLLERTTDLTVERRFGLGGTDICHAALVQGQLDLYVEYTGTGLLNVLQIQTIPNPDRTYLAVARGYRDRFGLEWLPPIGFNNTYAVAVREADAEARGWTTVGDLAGASDLRGGFTAEFMERPDGFEALKDEYGLEFASTRDLDPGLMYQAVAENQVDVIAAFATDARIEEYDLRILDDDRNFFPPYDAAPVVRTDLLEKHPEVGDALALLAGAISDHRMRRLNHAVDVEKRDPADVARRWIDDALGVTEENRTPEQLDTGAAPGFFSLALDRRAELADKTLRHLFLTAAGTLIAIAIGVPVGIFIHRVAPVRGPILGLAEIMQTIPSLAMLAFMFALYGLLGSVPAITALVLYALLPIVLNTFTGLREVPAGVVQAADAVGMSGAQRLRMVEIPLAAPVIIAGIRTATVLTVGIATLSTYIGAGGLGDFIARGLARSDSRLTLLGAVPAAIMAVVLSLGIRLVERALSHGRSR